MINDYFHNLLKFGGLRVKIKDISDGIRNVSIQGKIVDMNAFMILLDDETGKIFVRYRSRDLADTLAIGDRIRVQKCRGRIYAGILEIRLERSGRIIKLPESHVQYP
jgi:RNase P/RNase MRP subunit p29